MSKRAIKLHKELIENLDYLLTPNQTISEKNIIIIVDGLRELWKSKFKELKDLDFLLWSDVREKRDEYLKNYYDWQFDCYRHRQLLRGNNKKQTYSK